MAIGVVGVTVLLVVAYFFFTSAFFFRGIVLPRIGKMLNAKVEAEQIDFSLFGDLRLGGLKIRTSGKQPLLAAQEIRLEADWWRYLRGHRRLDAVHARGMLLHVVEDEEGRSNLDPVLKGLRDSKGGGGAVGVHDVRLSQCALRHTRGSVVKELSMDQFTLDHWVPNTAGTTMVKGTATQRRGEDLLSMAVSANAVYSLDAQGRPHSLKMNGQAQSLQAVGAYQHAEKLSAILRGELTPSELKSFSIDFAQAGQPLGQVAASGALDLSRGEGTLNCALRSIDRRVLNVLGATRGLDFGGTVINATNRVTVAGRQWAVSGPFHARNFSVTRDGRSTPPLELSAQVDAQMDLEARLLKLDTLNVLGMRQGQRQLAASLSAPMHLSWGETTGRPADAHLQVDLYNANLAEWQPFIGAYVKSGRLTAGLTLRYSGDNRRLSFGVGATGLGIEPTVKGLSAANLSLRAQGVVDNLRTMNLDHYRLQIADGTGDLALAIGSGSVDLRERWLDTTITQLRASLPWAAALLKGPAFTAAAGQAGFKGQLACRLGKGKPPRPELLKGRLMVTNYQGSVAGRTLRDVSAHWDMGLDWMDRAKGKIAEGTIQWSAGGQPAGTLSLRGEFDADGKTAKVAFNGSRLNQELVRPWLPSLPGGMALQSASVEASGTLEAGPGDVFALNGQVAANGLRLADKDGQLERAGVSFLAEAKGSASRAANGAWGWTLANLKGRVVRGAVAAGGFNASGARDAAKGEGKLGFAIENMDGAAWSPFLIGRLKGWRLEQGRVNGTGTATWTEVGSVLKAQLNLDDSSWRHPQGARVPHVFSMGVDVTLDPPAEDGALPWTVKGTVTSENKICGTLEVSGITDSAGRKGRFSGTVKDVNERLAGPLLSNWLGKYQLEGGRFSMAGGGAWGMNGLSQVKGTARFEGLEILDESGLVLGLPQSGRLTLDGEVNSGLWTLRQAEVALAATSELENVVSLKGTLDHTRPGEVGGKLKLTAGSLDFGSMYGWWKAWPRTQSAKSTHWRGLELDCSLRRGRLVQCTVSNLVAQVKLDGHERWLKGLRAVVNGAPVELDAAWKFDGPSPFVAAVARADGVPVGPLVNALRSDLEGQITGKLHLDARFQGSGTNATSLFSNLDGNATLDLVDAHIRPARDQANRSGLIHWIGKAGEVTLKISQVNEVISQVGKVNPLGNLLNVIPLFPKGGGVEARGVIVGVEVQISADKQKGQLTNSVGWQTADYRAETKGIVSQQQGWPPALQQPVSIYLPASQAKILRLPLLPGRIRETRLPHDFITIGGTVMKPQMRFSREQLSKNFPADFFSKLPLLNLLFRD